MPVSFEPPLNPKVPLYGEKSENCRIVDLAYFKTYSFFAF